MGEDGKQVFPALHTLTATRWTLLMARLFGRKRVTHDGDYRVTSYLWRGKLYLTDFSEA